jgi:hypothetical protein
MSLEYQRVVNLVASGSDGLDFREGGSFRHLPSDEGNENQQPAEVKLVALVLCFATILLQLVDEVARPVHLHPFNAFSCEVDDKPRDLRWSILPDELTNDQLDKLGALCHFGWRLPCSPASPSLHRRRCPLFVAPGCDLQPSLGKNPEGLVLACSIR